MAYEFSIGRFNQGDGLEDALSDMRPALEYAALMQVADLQRAFTVGGHQERGGQAWAPWSPAYARDRARKGRTKVLVDTGILRNSIHGQAAQTVPTVASFVLGSNVSYGAVHQYGANKQVTRKAHERAITRKRGKWVKDKDGKLKFRKGALLKKTITEEGEGDKLRKFKVPKVVLQNVKAASFTLTIPARPFVVMTDTDAKRFSARLGNAVDGMLNGPEGGNGA